MTGFEYALILIGAAVLTKWIMRGLKFLDEGK